MRNLYYNLANDGTRVNTYQEAVAAGRFSEQLETVTTPRGKVSPIREACLQQYGAVTPQTIAAVKAAIA